MLAKEDDLSRRRDEDILPSVVEALPVDEGRLLLRGGLKRALDVFGGGRATGTRRRSSSTPNRGSFGSPSQGDALESTSALDLPPSVLERSLARRRLEAGGVLRLVLEPMADGSGGDQGRLKVVEEVIDVLNANA